MSITKVHHLTNNVVHRDPICYLKLIKVQKKSDLPETKNVLRVMITLTVHNVEGLKCFTRGFNHALIM